ncbi:MAG TPA: response regulator transcription factor [Usitatibacter sp.]|nr:response regulator transcription factor [Usitatibacter sp.]
MISILLADDHPLVRAGIRSLIQEMEDARIVAEASNGREAVSMAAKLRPAVVVMDISMAELNGIEATHRIKTDSPETQVLILSMHSSEDFVRRSLAAGASGYLVKDSAPLELRLALEAICRGEVYVSSRVSKSLLSSLRHDGSQPGATTLNALTSRQREILQLVAEGKSTKEIEFTLEVSTKTVESHRAAIMQRLGIRDIAGLVIYAVRHRLVDVERPGS